MNYQQLKAKQKEFNLDHYQDMVNNGSIWSSQGSTGRFFMDLLNTGVLILPKKATYDYYGNRIPSRDDLKQGTKGTFQNAVNFWSNMDADTEQWLTEIS